MIGKPAAPSATQLARLYRARARCRRAGKPVTFRTLDIGARQGAALYARP
ncbi:MAG: hypothetical protein MZV49_04605 [Rhodopseudomonas palustris]|nr:hypothetical protein [Rhodopseudomonas palustris]